MDIKHKTLTKLLEYCSLSLFETVRKDISDNFEGVFIDDKNQVQDRWEVKRYLSTPSIEILEKLKVMYCFEKCGGELLYSGKVEFLVVICGILKLKEADNVFKAWYHNELNDTIPHFDLNVLHIPSIPSDFAITDMGSYFVIEQYTNGAYKPLADEKFMTREEAEKRIRELNRENDITTK